MPVVERIGFLGAMDAEDEKSLRQVSHEGTARGSAGLR
jgi:hypothetical protein